MKRKHIYVAYTGGTIGMRPAADGYRPAAGFLAEQMARMPELADARMPAWTVHEYDPLVDSADMTPEHWLAIARDIEAHYDAFDGFVVLHGTDTMAYTASALSFILQDLAKPVVLTGGQIPLCQVRNDSRENLITALMVAADSRLAEVCLLFGSRLLRGNRAVKVNAQGFDAFASPNFPALAEVGIDIAVRAELLRPKPAGKKRLRVVAPQKVEVAALRLFPGISAEVVANVLAPPVRGLVLETYGLGNAPAADRRLMEVLAEAVARGVVVVNCTQCLRGNVVDDAYATGSALRRAGVISGGDMTVEAALAKLYWLLGRGLSCEQVRRAMGADLRGERTAAPPDGH